METKVMLQKINLYLFDMDGTLYLGDRLYDFTKELLSNFQAKRSLVKRATVLMKRF